MSSAPVFRIALAAGILACFAVPSVRAQSAIAIVVPNDRSYAEGNSQAETPFFGPARFQQVYDASQFSAISDGGGLIRVIFFRVDGFCIGGFGATIPSLQVNLSTTSRGPDGLSAIFIENIGPDETVVFGPQLVHLVQPCSPGNIPQAFGVYIEFGTPFYYDPSKGNLLLDIRNLSGATSSGGALDAEFTDGDSVSVAFDTVADSSSARFVASYGLITDFGTQPLPRLHLSLVWTNLLFRWVNHPGGWTLQQSPIIGQGSTWQLAGGIAATNGVYKEVTLPLDTNTAGMFFRLVLPPPPQGRANVQTADVAVADSNPKH